jgi:hypothetical protein
VYGVYYGLDNGMPVIDTTQKSRDKVGLFMTRKEGKRRENQVFYKKK